MKPYVPKKLEDLQMPLTQDHPDLAPNSEIIQNGSSLFYPVFHTSSTTPYTNGKSIAKFDYCYLLGFSMLLSICPTSKHSYTNAIR